MKQKIAILGGGNLGRSIAEGLLEVEGFSPEAMQVTRRKAKYLQDLADRGVHTHSDNARAVRESEVIIAAVQPSQMPGVLAQVRAELDPQRHTLISLATGLTLAEIREHTHAELPVYRAMPNTAVALRESMTCICTEDQDAARKAMVKELFAHLGESILIEEPLMASATVLGACGIAYVMRFIRAASQGGVQIGFDADLAQMIVTQTVKGAAALLQEGGLHPEQEIDKVTTPRGCTIAGLNEMEHRGFSSSMIKGITTSHNKIADI
ncbi:MAG: pyrroline-5-carboxylate reductase [Bacteroidota bacterium]